MFVCDMCAERRVREPLCLRLRLCVWLGRLLPVEARVRVRVCAWCLRVRLRVLVTVCTYSLVPACACLCFCVPLL